MCIEGAVDSSGMQVLLTSRKPRHEAALMQVGVRTQPLLMLPPRQPSVATRGWCLDTCLQQVCFATSSSVVIIIYRLYLSGVTIPSIKYIKFSQPTQLFLLFRLILTKEMLAA
jgi:hypothetical protein